MIEILKNSLPKDVIGHVEDFKVDFDSDYGTNAILEALGNSVLAGGKRLRPMLTQLFGHYFGLDVSTLDVYSQSIEKVHAASLAHDDVIDNANTRRGEDALHIQTSNKKAILAGDYLLADVIVILAKLGNPQILVETSNIIKQLSLGEWLQADLIESRDYDQEKINKIAQYKTASVLSWCSVIPAIISGQDQQAIELSREIGKLIGVSFQEIDDTLDFSEFSLKDENLDIKNNLVNSVVYEFFKLSDHSFNAFKSGADLEGLINEDVIKEATQIVQKRALKRLDRAKSLISQLDCVAKLTREKKDPNQIEALRSLELICDFVAARTH